MTRRFVFLLVAFAACSDGAPTPAEEVAGELRALRQALARQPIGGPTATVDVKEALAPLREALTTLGAEQRQLAERQVALTQELQRWSTLLVQSAREETAESAKGLGKRLAELEADLKRQDERHRATETLLQGALERTADQLDVFLQRLETLGPARKTGPQTPLPDAGAGTGPGPAGSDGIVHGRPTQSRWWWLVVTGLGGGVATFFLRRPQRRPVAVVPAAVEPAPPIAAVVGGERSVEEIWAAAALLGEAVGRLRQTAAAEPVPDASAPAVAPPQPAATPAAPAAANAPVVAANEAPVLVALLPGHARPIDVLATLASERSVLRRPVPTVTPRDGHIEVRCHVLPGMPAGERARLVQRLRDAARRPRSSAD